MRFYIHSRESAVNCVKEFIDKRIAIISITDPKQSLNDFTKVDISEDRILRVQFHDLDRPLAGYKIFNNADAKQILDFVKVQIGLVDFFIVHCEAGISRSAGVAAALSKIYNGNDNHIFNCGKYLPNMLVYKTILNEYYRKGDK